MKIAVSLQAVIIKKRTQNINMKCVTIAIVELLIEEKMSGVI